MKEDIAVSHPTTLESVIRTIRGQRVILDADLARVYGVTTMRLNEAVRRNENRFPDDFAFQLTRQEFATLISQIAISKKGRGGRRTMPHAFTEYGALMAANVLRSARATQMSVFVVRAFVKMRSALTETRELACKLDDLEKKLTARIDNCDRAIIDVLQEIMRMLNPPAEPIVEPPPKRIGFGVREPRVRYGIRREEVAHA